MLDCLMPCAPSQDTSTVMQLSLVRHVFDGIERKIRQGKTGVFAENKKGGRDALVHTRLAGPRAEAVAST